MRLTIINAVMLATTAALTAVNLQPPTADAKGEFSPVEIRKEQKFDMIQARSIELVDENGERCVLLMAGRFGSGIWVVGEKQNAAIYTTHDQGPTFALMDTRNVGKGAPLAFSLDGDGKPLVQIVDGEFNSFPAKSLVPKK